jgi:hypothetical protein
MNDPGEFEYARGFMKRELRDRLKQIMLERQRRSLGFRRFLKKQGPLPQLIDHEVDIWVDGHFQALFTVDGHGGPHSVPFCVPHITSFCSHAKDMSYERENGLLSQWRGYGNVGAFALVFETAILEKMLDEDYNAHAYVHEEFFDVHYDRDPSFITSTYSQILDDMVQSYTGRVIDNDELKLDYFEAFKKTCGRLKHQGFHEEREIRIVTYPVYQEYRDHLAATYQDDPRATIPLKAMVRTGKKPHISLLDKIAAPLPIKLIIVGPSTTQTEDIERARTLTKGKVKVRASETPYKIIQKDVEEAK